MKINVTSNTKAVLAQIQADQAQITTAQVQALNRTAQQVLTGATREIRKTYNVKAKVLKQMGKINRAGRNQQFPTAVVTFTGRGIPLIEFDPSERTVQSSHGRRRAVTVRVTMRGGRKLVQGGFIATIKSGPMAGQKGIFKRAPGAKRFPIKFQSSISIPLVLRQKAIEATILALADDSYSKNFAAALRNQVNRG